MSSVKNIVKQLADAGIIVLVKDGQLTTRNKPGAITPQMAQLIRDNKTALIEFLQAVKVQQTQTTGSAKITKRSENQALVLSHAQQRMWLLDRLQGGSSAYNITSQLQLDGPFDCAIAERAFKQILTRHIPLRSNIIEQDGEPQIQLQSADGFCLKQLELDKELELNKELECSHAKAIDQAINQNNNQGFDLAKDLLLRACYIRLSKPQEKQQGILLLCVHHIAADGWSMGILVDEFCRIYASLSASISANLGSDLEPQLSPLEIDYADYALWQRRHLDGDVLERQLKFWQQNLAGAPAIHALPLDFTRPAVKSYQGKQLTTQLTETTTQSFLQVARKHQVTHFMLLHGALSLVFARFAQQSDVIIGTAVANRLREQLTPLIGFFVNTLVLRVDTNIASTLTDYLAHVRQVNLQAQAHQDLPFEQLVEQSQVSRSQNTTPIFQLMLVMDEQGAKPSPDGPAFDGPAFDKSSSANQFGELQVSQYGENQQAAKFDISVSASINPQNMSLQWVYDESIFAHSTIARLSEQLVHMLELIVSSETELTIEQLMVLPKPQLQQLADFSSFDDCSSEHSLPQQALNNIAHCFEHQVSLTPDSTALVFTQQRVQQGVEHIALTYTQVNQQANQLARLLQHHGVQAGDLVGLMMSRSEQMFIGLLAILKAGAAYVPLDPAYPQSRLTYMINDAALSLVLLDAEFLGDELPQPAKALSFDQDALSAFADHNLEIPATENTPSNTLAYVVYTSGSTGQPKGVMVNHAGALNMTFSQQQVFKVKPDSKVLHFASMSFDASVSEWMMALLSGACLVIASDDERHNAAALQRLLAEQRITHATIPPVLVAHLDPHYKNGEQALALECLILAGESCPNEVVDKWLQVTNVYNAYGPSEASVCTTIGKLNAQEPINIGRPINNMHCHVLDEKLAPVPLGAVGELYIAGIGLANGYLNLPDKTADAFIDVQHQGQNKRLYKSGDRVRMLANGKLQFVGRVDSQVKVRGFRVELGEIEQQLNHLTEVESALVRVITDKQQQGQLVAYFVVKAEQVNKEDLLENIRAGLSKQLPEHMVPNAFIPVDKWPMTANGKIDIKALPSIDERLIACDFVAPKGDIERALADIWQQLFNLPADKISALDNFFTLGGHSLLLIKLLARIRDNFDVELTTSQIFEQPTITHIAAQIAAIIAVNKAQIKATSRAPVTAVKVPSEGAPLSFGQHRLWFIDQMGEGSGQYNIPLALKVGVGFDVDAAELAINQLIERHHILRSYYVEHQAKAYQRVKDSFNFTFNRLVMTEAKLKLWLKDESRASFDLSDSIIRGAFIKLTDGKFASGEPCKGVMYLNIHHIAADGWSMGILQHEFSLLYQGIVNKVKTPLVPLALQYSDYAIWQQQSQHQLIDEQLTYWQQQLSEIPLVHGLPLNSANSQRPANKGYLGEQVTVHLDESTTKGLLDLAKAYQLTPFMLLHASLALVLSRHSYSQDIVIGTPVANRMQTELEPLIGFFVNTLVLRTSTDFAKLDDYLAHVRDINLAALANQDIGFDQLVEKLDVERSSAHTPLFQILFTLVDEQLNQHASVNSTAAINPLPLEPLAVDQVTVKFDLDITAAISQQDTGAESLSLNLAYDVNLFSHSMIERLACHWQHLLGVLSAIDAAKPEAIYLKQLPMMGKEELQQLLAVPNQPQGCFEDNGLLHQQFERMAQKYPDATALVFEQQSISYQQLNERANRLAHYLREMGIGNLREKSIGNVSQPDDEDLVGLYLERGFDMVIGILAILKAGGAYVPLDHAHPINRVNYAIEDAKLKLVISQQSLIAKLTLSDDVVTCVVDDGHFIAQVAQYNSDNLAVSNALKALGGQALAYVIYTSGSTGLPKGVLQTHYNVSRLFMATDNQFAFDHQDTWTLFHSIAFDFSVWELWGPLLFGGRLVIPSYQCTRDVSLFVDLCVKQKVSVLNQTPSAFNAFTEQAITSNCQFEALRLVIFGGEALKVDGLVPWWKHYGEESPSLINMYGITETTVHVSFKRLSLGDCGSSDIGHRLADQVLYLLDHQLLPVPKGCVGQIYVGGAGLARGYLARPELTAERFIANPYDKPEYRGDIANPRLYQTGDLARQLDNGHLAFIGRADSQVKIRGFRIELGEIETRLASAAEVANCLVIVDEARLVAYVQPNEPMRSQLDSKQLNQNLVKQLTTYLSEHLPSYMVPSVIMCLAQFPLTANGKIDRQALPEPIFTGQTLGSKPQTDQEIMVAKLWAEVLKLDWQNISREDNFFALGGHSLSLIQYRSGLNQLGFDLPISALYQAHTLADLACQLEDSQIQLAPVSDIPKGAEKLEPQMLPMVDLSAEQFARLNKLLSETAIAENGMSNIVDIYPLSPLQQGMLFHSLLSPEQDPYVIKTVLKCQTREQLDKFIIALEKVIHRHDALRTGVIHNGLETPLQVVFDAVKLPVVWLEPLNEDEVLSSWLAHYSLKQTNFLTSCTAPLMQLHVLPRDNAYIMVLFNHHIVEDNLSLRVLLDEVTRLIDNPEVQLPPATQYRQFIWQGMQMDQQGARAFFAEYLAGFEQLSAPYELTDLDSNFAQMHSYDEEISAGLSDKLQQLAVQCDVSLSSVLHLAWAIVVGRTSGVSDVAFGTVLSGRMMPVSGIERMVGLCINTLPLRMQLGDLSLTDALFEVQQSLNQLLNYEQCSLAFVKESIKADCDIADGPLFTSILNCRLQQGDNEVDAKAQSLVNDSGIQALWTQEHTNYPLTASIGFINGSLNVNIESRSPIDPQQIATYLHNVLMDFCYISVNQSLKDVAMLQTEVIGEFAGCFAEKANNGVDDMQQQPQGLHQLIEQQVANTLNNDAICFYDSKTCQYNRISYGELNQRANQIAKGLLAYKPSAFGQNGNDKDWLVGLYMPRSMDLLAAILGILKAGGAYVPLDSQYPNERLAYMVKDSGMSTLVCGEQLPSFDCSNLDVLTIEQLIQHPQIAKHLTTDIEVSTQVNGNDLAYVIYTSGSTGQAKGVMIEHSAISLHSQAVVEHFALDGNTRALQFASVSFDTFAEQTFGVLVSGGCVHLRDDSIWSAPQFYRYCNDMQINLTDLSPLYFAQVLSHPQSAEFWADSSIKQLVVGGDVLPQSVIKTWFELKADNHCQLYNAYGPTESTITTTIAAIRRNDNDEMAAQSVSIGQPFKHRKLYIVDSDGRLTPNGVIGRLLIGGAGLARGYLGKASLTAEKFATHPLAETRLYDSGDLVRLNHNNELEFCGRYDEQVKIRGFRVELGEIENAILLFNEAAFNVAAFNEAEYTATFAPIAQAVVLYQDQRLRAWLQLSASSSSSSSEAKTAEKLTPAHKQALIEHLQQHLPKFMLPTEFLVLEQMPLLPNGKVNRKQLPTPDSACDHRGDSATPTSYQQPSIDKPTTDTQIKLAAIWAQLLAVTPDAISLTDNFIDLGGHSILMMKLQANLSVEFDLEYTLAQLFSLTDLTAMAADIEKRLVDPSSGRSNTQLLPLDRTGAKEQSFRLSFAQQRLWFIYQLQGASHEYNMANAIEVRGDFNVEVATKALRLLIERNEILRTVYKDTQDGSVQVIKVLDSGHNVLEQFDLTQLPDEQKQQQLQQLAQQNGQYVFDLSQDLMLKAAYVKLTSGLDNTTGVLLFTLHHIACDGWSISLLLSQFVECYKAVKAEQQLPSIPLQYADFAQWQQNSLELNNSLELAQGKGQGKQQLNEQLSYWQQYLDDAPSCHGLRLDFPRKQQQRRGALHTSVFNPALLEQINQRLKAQGCTLFMLLQSTLAVHIGRLSGENDVVIGAPDAGRERAELQTMIGMFLNTRIYRTRFDANTTFEQLLAQTYQDHISNLAHNDVPFEAIVERVQPQRSLEHSPIFQIMLNDNSDAASGADVSQLSLDGVEFAPFETPVPENKYDLTVYFSTVSASEGSNKQQLVLNWVYDGRLFKAETINSFAVEFEHLLSQMLSAPQKPVLSHNWHNALPLKALPPLNQPLDIMAMFSAQVAKAPNKLALQYQQSKLTFAQLDNKANQLAHVLVDYLDKADTQLNKRVAIAMTRNTERVIAILAVLKLAGCYVPISEELPTKRMEYMIKDSGATLVLTDNMVLAKHAWLKDADNSHYQLVSLDDADVVAKWQQANTQAVVVAPPRVDDIAHIIYTSGSTGQPKGVLGTYGATANRISWMHQEMPFADDELTAHITSMAFIRGVWELLVPLCGGCSLVLMPRETVRQVDVLWQQLNHLKVTRIVTAPSLLNALLALDAAIETGSASVHTSLRYWFVSGEPLLLSDAKAVLARLPQTKFYNLYGSTEVMSDVLYSQISHDMQGAYAPVGAPITGVKAAIVGVNNQPVPTGVVGQIMVYGKAIAFGYNHQQAKGGFGLITIDDKPQPVYNTGDLGWMDQNGQIHCLGRMDDQIKIRGYRIELSEINQQLAACDGVDSCRVYCLEGNDKGNDKLLVAYVKTTDMLVDFGPLQQKLKQQLEQVLPTHMLPQAYVAIENWPLKPNGKIDRKALPTIQSADFSAATGMAEYQAPTNPQQQQLQDIWCQLLGLKAEQVSINAKFFDVGGHSLLLIRLVALIDKATGIRLGVAEAMTANTISAQSDLIEHYHNQQQLSEALNQDNEQEVERIKL